MGGHHHFQLGEQVTALAVLGQQTIALDPQALATLAVGADGQVDLAGQGRHRDLGAQRRFPRRQRHGNDQVVPFDIEQRVRRKLDDQVQVAIGTTAHTRCALALEANALAVGHPGRNLHVQGLDGIAGALAGAVVLRHLEADLLRLVGQGFFEENRQFHFHILSAPTGAALLAATKRVAVATAGRAEYGTEEIREIAAFLAKATTSPAFPAWRPLERATVLAVFAQLVVLGAFFRVAQCFVGLVGLFEFVLRVLFFADVGVILAGELAVGGLDRLVIRRGLDAKYLVVVFEIHLRNHSLCKSVCHVHKIWVQA
ncbi:hypothetical protein D9M71_215900 [compost metagenome]